MPSSRIWPSLASAYDSSRSWSTGSYFWPCDGVDLQLAEQRVHAERARLVGDDRHDALAELLVAGQVAQQAGEAHRGADRLVARAARAARRTTVGSGSSSGSRGRGSMRLGMQPPSGRRRSIMYWYSIESSGGRKYGMQVALERARRGSRRAGTGGRAARAADPWSSS